MDPLAAKIAAYYPAPNAPGTVNYQSYIGEALAESGCVHGAC